MDKQIIARLTSAIVCLSMLCALLYFVGAAIYEADYSSNYKESSAFLKPYEENLYKPDYNELVNGCANANQTIAGTNYCSPEVNNLFSDDSYLDNDNIISVRCTSPTNANNTNLFTDCMDINSVKSEISQNYRNLALGLAFMVDLGVAAASIGLALCVSLVLNAKAKNSFVVRLLFNQHPEAQELITPGAAGLNYQTL